MVYSLALQMQAYKLLQDPQVGGTADPEGILRLCRDAGYSEEVAQKAASRRANQRLDEGLPLFQTRYVHQ